MIANKYFRQNLENLLFDGKTHQARAIYTDGTQALKTSLYNVFETYPKGVLPIHTLRETPVKLAIQEILWIYKDQSNELADAHKRGIYWWDNFNVGDGIIGYDYGYLVYNHRLMDNLLKDMVENPFSNRHKIDLSDAQLDKEQIKLGGLVACANRVRFNIEKTTKGRDVHVYLEIRSSDYITAGAINRIQYYSFASMICGHLSYATQIIHEIGSFSVLTNDMHYYDRHLFAINELLKQDDVDGWNIELKGYRTFYDYDIDDFVITRPKGLYKLSQPLEIAI